MRAVPKPPGLQLKRNRTWQWLDVVGSTVAVAEKHCLSHVEVRP